MSKLTEKSKTPVSPDVYTTDYYLKEAAGYEEFLSSKGRCLQRRDRQVLRAARLGKGERILDVGCGRGEMVVQSMLLGATAIGIDYSESAVAIAREAIYCASRSPGLEGKALVCRADAQYLPVSSESFDKVLMIDVFEHL